MKKTVGYTLVDCKGNEIMGALQIPSVSKFIDKYRRYFYHVQID
jgi:hypothetical protein